MLGADGGISALPRALRLATLVVLVGASTALALAAVEDASLVAPFWPAAGLAAGAYLTTRCGARSWVLAGLGLLTLVVHLTAGFPIVVAAGFSLSCAAETWVVRRSLLRHRPDERAALLDQGDVSNLVVAVALGASVATLGYVVTDALTGHGNPLLVVVGVWSTHAAALMLVLPYFLPGPAFAPLAGRRERYIQWALTLGTTVAIFLAPSAPPVVFVIMPMFAWLAFRGTLRETAILLNVVAGIVTGMTAFHLGPIWRLGELYDLPPEVVIGILQLFLIDCGLIMLPLSVAVTQERTATARAAAGREMLERLVSSATGTGIVAIDLTGRITVFNPGAEGMLGHAAADVIGQTPDRFHPADELERFAEELGTQARFLDICRAVVDSDEPRRLWRFVRCDGEERTMLMTLSAIPGARGGIIGYVSTAEDVTEREVVQAALEQALAHERSAVDRLQELDEVRSNFVAAVSHELRTPITSILGYTELLEDGLGGELSSGQRDLVDRVDRNSRRLLLLIEDLLTLAQIEAAELTMEPVLTDLRHAVHRARASVSPTLEHRRLTVTVAVPETPVLHDGDPAQLERMVLNLLTNAVKFTPDGGLVEIDLGMQECRSRLVVRDTGLGIPEHEQARLFTRFFRSSTATEMAIQGTGLGLSIVHAIVTLHGGEIGVDSGDGGTTVTVTLPHAAVGSD